MKVVILAGGLGTRISEETHLKPKPMILIGNKPILWHIMKIFSAYGHNEFIICCGYKGNLIKEYFVNYFCHSSDLSVDLKSNTFKVNKGTEEDWKVRLVETGQKTMTGGRLLQIKDIVENETFLMTYGDGVSNVDINSLINFHTKNNSLATVTAVKPAGRFGILDIDKFSKVNNICEKPKGDGSWVNGGFFVLEPSALDTIKDDSISWEEEPLSLLSKAGNLKAFKHDDFWQPMDTLRDKIKLEELWASGNAPWKIWE